MNSSAGSFPEGHCATLPDGTIALLSAKEEDGDLEWGIASDYDQLLLPYPAVGCASIELGTAKQQPLQLAACCLRGGSTYLIPFPVQLDRANRKNRKMRDDTPIHVFTFETDTHARYVSDFTAGNLLLSSFAQKEKPNQTHHNGETTAKTTAPVLIYAWAGGIVDVYSCELLETPKPTCRPVMRQQEVSTLEQLISNGSLSLLVQLLSALEDSDPLLRQALWKEARRECRESSMEGVFGKDLLSPKFAAIRSLLLLLSSVSS